MSGFSIQFYALPQEVFNFASEIQIKFQYYVVRLDRNPFNATLVAVSNDKMSSEQMNIGTYEFYTYKPDLLCDTQNRFLDKNPNSLHLAIGTLNNNSLSESLLSTISDESASLAFAKKASSRLKKITKAGVMFKNIDSGAETLIRAYRYTEEVQKKHTDGLHLLGLTPKIMAYIPNSSGNPK